MAKNRFLVEVTFKCFVTLDNLCGSKLIQVLKVFDSHVSTSKCLAFFILALATEGLDAKFSALYFP